MKERPILFSSPMVRAILDGSKTMTRRAVKGYAQEWLSDDGFTPEFVADPKNHLCPYGKPGDRLWCRETWSAFDGNAIRYAADNVTRVFPVSWPQSAAIHGLHARHGNKRRPSIHMPRWASRILLEIVSVRVERLQDISEDDARAEGIAVDGNGHAVRDDAYNYGSARTAFAELWESINGAGSWAANPWVWVAEFRRVETTEGRP